MSFLTKSISKFYVTSNSYRFTDCRGYKKLTIDLAEEKQLLLETGKCNLILPDDYKLEASACSVNGLTGCHLTADVDLFSAIERQDWHEVSTIYQTVFRPHLEQFAQNCILKAIAKQVA